MEFKFIFISFTLFFFNSVHAACVPRNAAMSCPNPHAPKNIKPVSPQAVTPDKSPDRSLAVADAGNMTSGVVDAVMSGLPQASGNENPEITRICGATDFPDVCLATLGRFNGPTDMPSILSIAIQAGMDLGKAAVGTADRLTFQPGTPQDQVALLSDCRDSYDDYSYNFQNAHDALPGKDVGTMNTMLSAAITDVGDCEDSFVGLDCPLAPFSEKLRKMASNCLAMITQMK